MILELPHLTEEEYKKTFSSYYEKPNKPDIEYQLQDFQKRLLVNQDYTVLPDFKKSLSEYSKSLLLKCLKGSTDYIESEQVEVLANIAAENFIKRYFRNEDSVVGASFAGILKFKVREVLSNFFKQKAIESKLSLDVVFGDTENSNTAMSVESLISYQKYQDQEYDIDDSTAVSLFKKRALDLINQECDLLAKVDKFPNLDTTFLIYLIYLTILQKTRLAKKMTIIAKQAIRLIETDEDVLVKLTPILESALLDVQVNPVQETD